MLPEQDISSQLSVLVSHRIVQSVGSDISPESVQPNLAGSCPGASHFKHSRCHPKTNIRGDNLDGGNQLGPFTTLLDGEGGSVVLVGAIDAVSFGPSLVGKGLGSTEVGEEVAVGGENVELIGGLLLVLFWLVRRCFLSIVGKDGTHVAAVWPRSCAGCGVLLGKVQGTEGDAKVEIAEHELNTALC